MIWYASKFENVNEYLGCAFVSVGFFIYLSMMNMMLKISEKIGVMSLHIEHLGGREKLIVVLGWVGIVACSILQLFVLAKTKL